MGLDISVNVSSSEFNGNLSELPEGPKELAASLLEDHGEFDRLETRPGGYGGLHAVRNAYARLKGWQIIDETVPVVKETCKSHLINHQDNEGFYLPHIDCEPIWTTDGYSIGSSQKLLDELYELHVSGTMSQSERSSFKAVFLAAAASVCCSKTIYFG